MDRIIGEDPWRQGQTGGSGHDSESREPTSGRPAFLRPHRPLFLVNIKHFGSTSIPGKREASCPDSLSCQGPSLSLPPAGRASPPGRALTRVPLEGRERRQGPGRSEKQHGQRHKTVSNCDKEQTSKMRLRRLALRPARPSAANEIPQTDSHPRCELSPRFCRLFSVFSLSRQPPSRFALLRIHIGGELRRVSSGCLFRSCQSGREQSVRNSLPQQVGPS